MALSTVWYLSKVADGTRDSQELQRRLNFVEPANSDSMGFLALAAFRHFYASLLLPSGAAQPVAQKQLRHSDARITLDSYALVVGHSHREAINKWALFMAHAGSLPGGLHVR